MEWRSHGTRCARTREDLPGNRPQVVLRKCGMRRQGPGPLRHGPCGGRPNAQPQHHLPGHNPRAQGQGGQEPLPRARDTPGHPLHHRHAQDAPLHGGLRAGVRHLLALRVQSGRLAVQRGRGLSRCDALPGALWPQRTGARKAHHRHGTRGDGRLGQRRA